jgi:hypothetical protein
MNPRMDQELSEYQGENLRIYGCCHCKRTDVSLQKVGHSSEGLTLYSCTVHAQLMVPQ